MSRPTAKQQSILAALDKEQDGTIAKKKLLELFGHWYYCNAAFHLGNVLSRMVVGGMLERVERGVYRRANPGRSGLRDTARADWGELWGGKEGQ